MTTPRDGNDEPTIQPAALTLEDGLRAARDRIKQNDLPGALACYAELRGRFRDRSILFREPARALLETGGVEEAEILLEHAIARFPGEMEAAADLAWAAHRRKDHAEATRRWSHVRSAFPDRPIGYLAAATSLREAGDLDQAEALARNAAERFPATAEPLVELAWIAYARAGADAASDHFATIRSRFPAMPIGYVGGAIVLRNTARRQEAEALIATAVQLFPREPVVLIEFARVAMARRDWTEAVARWRHVREQLPPRADTLAEEGISLREIGEYDQAEAVLRDAATKFPNDPRLVLRRAENALARGDAAFAATLLRDAELRFPADAAIRKLLAATRHPAAAATRGPPRAAAGT